MAIGGRNWFASRNSLCVTAELALTTTFSGIICDCELFRFRFDPLQSPVAEAHITKQTPLEVARMTRLTLAV